jgi:hypothetical protein
MPKAYPVADELGVSPDVRPSLEEVSLFQIDA